MALSGLQIYKLLPKTNCKDCGFPTCLAFAMKLAQKGVELAACPHVSPAAKEALAASARPPIQLVTVGTGERAFSVGNEVVLFRHEKTFFNPTALGVRVRSSQPREEVANLVARASAYSTERVGMALRLSVIAVQDDGGSADAFAACVDEVASRTALPLILMSRDPAVMEEGLAKAGDRRPLIYAADADNVDRMAALAGQRKLPLAVYGENLSETASVVERANAAGVEELVVDPGARGFGPTLQVFTQARRLALRANERRVGYPIIAFPSEGVGSAEKATLLAGQLIAKYAGIVILDHFSPEAIYPLLTLRQNLYTDPQKPIQVEPGVYPIREPDRNSPVLVTTNFSLTYFSITGEVDSGGVPAWVVICDTDGQSVLTSWAAGKFDGVKIANTVNAHDVPSKVDHRLLVIPGHVAVLSGEIEEELPGWTVLVGPRDAIDVVAYVKNVWAPRLQESRLQKAGR